MVMMIKRDRIVHMMDELKIKRNSAGDGLGQRHGSELGNLRVQSFITCDRKNVLHADRNAGSLHVGLLKQLLRQGPGKIDGRQPDKGSIGVISVRKSKISITRA